MPDLFTLNVGALHDWLLAKWSDEIGVTDGLVVVPEDMTFGDFNDENLGRRVDDYVLQLLTLDLETDAPTAAIGQPDGWTILVYPTDDEYSHGYLMAVATDATPSRRSCRYFMVADGTEEVTLTCKIAEEIAMLVARANGLLPLAQAAALAAGIEVR